MYIRTKDGIYRHALIGMNHYKYIGCETSYGEMHGDDWSLVLEKEIIKQADTIRGLIMKGDLVFAKDGYAGINATEHPSIAINDIDKCTQYFEKHITRFYIELSNGDYHLVAKEKRGELEML